MSYRKPTVANVILLMKIHGYNDLPIQPGPPSGTRLFSLDGKVYFDSRSKVDSVADMEDPVINDPTDSQLESLFHMLRKLLEHEALQVVIDQMMEEVDV